MKENCDCEVAWLSIDMGLNASVPTPICIWTISSVKSTLSTLIFTHDCDIPQQSLQSCCATCYCYHVL